MREISFRAWNKVDKSMSWTFSIYKVNTIGRDDIGDWIFLQYTGLKDMNGKRIYEGDIVQYKHYLARRRWWNSVDDIPIIKKEVEKQREDYQLNRDEIKYRDGCFGFGYSISGEDIARGERLERSGSHGCDVEEKWWGFEVIGNVYENPELLEEGRE